MSRPPFDIVLFDLGGVLIRLGGVNPMQRLTGIASEAEVWRRWLACPWVRQFERGRCDARDFAAGLVAEWGLNVEPEEFLSEFESWPQGVFDGASELVAEVRAQLPVGCLSNTNALHWAAWASWGLADMFDARFLSFEVGYIKPDRQMFDHASSTLGLAPEKILFLDDNAINVSAAAEAGLIAREVRGIQQARATLTEFGVLAAPRQAPG
ncbi:MAG TPA: HAD family phosphatase [Chloroflexota bacterium]|nr:HAD family phosphatase [Chloroflexota bacterium]